MSAPKYSGRLFPVQFGQLISVVGKACNNPERLVIDLDSGNDPKDILLHISARFQEDDSVIVRNAKEAGAWGSEERGENLLPFNSLNPLKPGGDFKIDIFVDKNAYIVSIDEKPFCTFIHRMHIDNIQKINISGDVEAVYQVNQKNAQARPWPAVNVNAFEAFGPNQFNPGNVVVITGTPKGNENGDFTVEFYDGSNRFRRHFQLHAFIGNKSLVLKTQNENGEFIEDLTSSTNHNFNICETFKLAIAMTNENFQIAINGQKMDVVMPYNDHHERLFGSLTGIAIISKNGLNVDVQGVNFMLLEADCERFEAFTNI